MERLLLFGGLEFIPTKKRNETLHMKLHFLGANRQVTGSRYVLEVGDKLIMLDCGMFQERPFESRNWDVCPIPAAKVDAMLLTHIHIDHCGLIPKLVKEGFRGPIHTTKPSAALAETMLRDSAQIQLEDTEYKKKRRGPDARSGKNPIAPLYTDDDVTTTLPLFQGCGYHQPIQVTDQVTAIFHDAGHILGSAMIEVLVTEFGKTKRIVFSGDIGQWDKPIIRDPELLPDADYVVMESTYGDKLHEDGGDIGGQLAKIINETHARGGHVIIPTFATERAQELMYYFGRLVHANLIPRMAVYLDSPMAVDVSEIFLRFPDYFDEEMLRLIAEHTPPLKFPGLTMCRTAEESKKINAVRTPSVIMASSGMCNAGRIKHHLRNNIGRPECTILFVGYQGDGTLGRQILDGAKSVRIFGEMLPVRAKVAQIFGFSAHADKNGLLKWLTHFKQPKNIFLTHGEEAVALNLATHITNVLKWPVHVPQYREMVDIV